MSDLLRKKPKKLLDRGKQITPETTFTLDEEKNKEVSKQPAKQPPANTEKKADLNPQPSAKQLTTTTVRVSMSTKEKLNALVTLGTADSVDSLIEILIEEYHSSYLTKDEKKQYSLILDIYASKKKKK